jgi:hypothetical protein
MEIIMSLNKIRGGIVNRTAKIKSMKFAFDSDEKINQYKQISLKILKDDYIAEVRAMQEQDRARLQEIEASYRKAMPSLSERHQRLALLQNEHRGMSLPQLKAAATESLSFPPMLQDPNELRSLAAELRSRGDGDTADTVAGFTEAQRVAEPWTHDQRYQALEKRVTKLDVYTAQASEGTMFVLSDDPDHISQSDIITFEKIDEGLPEAS